METLKNKIVVIVGANSDVGETVAKTLAKHSVKLILCGTSLASLEELKEECSKTGLHKNNILNISMVDMSKKAEIESVIQKTIEHFGCFNSLIYLVENSICKSFEETSIDDLNISHLSNVETPLTWVQLTVPHLKVTKGNVIILSPDYLQQSIVGMFPYSLAKATKDHLVKTMALDLAGYGIRVNSVCPMYPTEKKENATTEWKDILSSLSEFVAYLSTDVAAFITGQCIPIGNGFKIDQTS